MTDNDWHDLTCYATASEVTTLWRYRNECIIIFIIIILQRIIISYRSCLLEGREKTNLDNDD